MLYKHNKIILVFRKGLSFFTKDVKDFLLPRGGGGGIDAKKREETIRDTYTILPNNARIHIHTNNSTAV